MNNKENGSTWALYADGTHVPVETKVQGRFTVAGMSVARQLCRLGHGVSVLDEHIAATDLAEGHLLRVLPHWRLAPTPVNLLTPSRLMPARVRLFCDFLSARFQR